MSYLPMSNDLRRVRATENVQMQRQFGSGLGAQAAMQNPNYELGSGSALRQAPRQLGTQSGAMRREARRLRKQGYTAQAGQLAGAAAMQKLQEGSAIKSEAQRGREMGQMIQQAEANRQMQGLTQDLMNLRREQIQAERDRLAADKAEPDWTQPRYAQSSKATSSLPSSGTTAKSVGSTGTASTSNQTSLSTLDPAQMETEGSGQAGGMLTGAVPAAPAAPKPSLIGGKPASEVLASYRDQRAKESDPEGYARKKRREAIQQEAKARAAKQTDGGIVGYTMAELAETGGYEYKAVTPEQQAGADAYSFDQKQSAAQAEKDKATRAQDAESARLNKRAEELLKGYGGKTSTPMPSELASLNTGRLNTGGLKTGRLKTGRPETGRLKTGGLRTGGLNTGRLRTGLIT